MSNSVRIILIMLLMAVVIGVSYWYMQETTGRVEQAVEQKWRLRDHLYAVSFHEGVHGWAVGAYGTILSSADGGRSWEYQRSGVADSLLSVFAVTSDNAWAVGTQGTVLTTSDGGLVWRQVQLGTRILLTNVYFTDRQNGWIVGEFESIYQTTDGGVSWTLVNGGEPGEIDFSQLGEGELVDDDFGSEEEVYTLNNIFFLNDTRGWCVGEYGTILMTNDGGSAWKKLSHENDKTLCAVDFYDENFGFAVGLDGTILKTTDGGLQWSPEKPTLITHYYGVHFKRYGSQIERMDALAVGQGVIAKYSYHKHEYLQNWVPALEMKHNIDYNWIYDVKYISKTGETVIAVGHEGLILMSTTGGSEWDIVRYPEKSLALVTDP